MLVLYRPKLKHYSRLHYTKEELNDDVHSWIDKHILNIQLTYNNILT